MLDYYRSHQQRPSRGEMETMAKLYVGTSTAQYGNKNNLCMETCSIAVSRNCRRVDYCLDLYSGSCRKQARARARVRDLAHRADGKGVPEPRYFVGSMRMAVVEILDGGKSD